MFGSGLTLDNYLAIYTNSIQNVPIFCAVMYSNIYFDFSLGGGGKKKIS